MRQGDGSWFRRSLSHSYLDGKLVNPCAACQQSDSIRSDPFAGALERDPDGPVRPILIGPPSDALRKCSLT